MLLRWANPDTPIEDICNNLKRFFQWSTENCQSGHRRIQALEGRCDDIARIQAEIQNYRRDI